MTVSIDLVNDLKPRRVLKTVQWDSAFNKISGDINSESFPLDMTSEWLLLCQQMCVSDKVTSLSNSISKNFAKSCYA